MNGLEAIELMQQGKMVVCKHGDDVVINKIIDGSVCFMYRHLKDGSEWEIDDCFDFTKSYEEYIEPKPLTGWERVGRGENYMVIDHSSMSTFTNYDDEYDDKLYEFANYFSTKEKAEEINFKQTLFRKLQRFSDENGGNEIDWNNEIKMKWGIWYNYEYEELASCPYVYGQAFGQVYFISEEVAEKAIELFRDELIKYFTHDFGGDR